MNEFSQLLENLLITTSKKKKINLIVNFLHESNLSTKSWALTILTNSIKNKNIYYTDLKKLIKKKIPEQLFDYSYDYVGDLAETISLLWPTQHSNYSFSLDLFMQDFYFSNDKNYLINKLEVIFDRSGPSIIFAIIKILTGNFRVGVSKGLIRESLIKYGSRSPDEIDEYWHGFTQPFKDFFKWLEGGELPKNIKKENLFNSFMLAKPIDDKILTQEPKEFIAEYKWDGIRAQINTSQKFKIFSRNSEDITNSFPELIMKNDNHYVLDGEIVIKKENKILSFNNLQKRIRRKNVSKNLLVDYPAHFIAYDIIYFNGKKCTNLSLLERKKLLNKFFSYFSSRNYSLSPIIPFSNWECLESIKSNSLNNHIEGLMVKRSSSLYEKGRVSNSWYKWKRKPFIIDFILIYAQRGHGKRSSFYSDFTFGCWVDNGLKELVPVGKAYSGFTNDELDKLDRWVRSNTVEKFGPVRSLKPGLVIEVAFDNINFSERHKSGVALRFPRFNRIRWDKPIEDVCILQDIKSLIN